MVRIEITIMFLYKETRRQIFVSIFKKQMNN